MASAVNKFWLHNLICVYTITAMLLGVNCGCGKSQSSNRTVGTPATAGQTTTELKWTTYTDPTGTIVKILCYKESLQPSRLTSLDSYPSVRHVVFQECSGLTSETLEQLKRLPVLEELSILNSPLEESIVDTLVSLRTLKSVQLVNCGITGTSLEKLAALPLEHVEILDRQLSIEGANAVAKIPTLKSLKLASPGVPLARLEGVVQHPSLEELDVAMCPTGENWVRVVAGIPQLKRVLFDSQSLDEATLAQLVQIPTLEELDLSGSPLGDESLRLLEGRPTLVSLSLKHCKNLSDEALQYVARLPHLKRLNISESSITAEGLHYLVPLRSLQELTIHQMQTRGRSAALAAFRQARPDCAVTVDQDLMY